MHKKKKFGDCHVRKKRKCFQNYAKKKQRARKERMEDKFNRNETKEYY